MSTHRLTVLLVEHNSDKLSGIELKYRGYRVIPAATRMSAEKILRGNTRIDVLFTDLWLGDGTGAQILAGMTRKRVHRIVTILVTRKGQVTNSIYPGFDDYIIKPITDSLLIRDTVGSCLQIRSEEEEEEEARLLVVA